MGRVRVLVFGSECTRTLLNSKIARVDQIRLIKLDR